MSKDDTSYGLRPRLHETGTKLNQSGTISFHSIIYNRCLHETGMKNVQAGLKSSRPLDRADYLQTGTNPERDESEHRYISDRSQLRSLLRNNACSTNRCKKKQQWQAEE